MKDFVLELIAAVGGALGITLIFLTFTRGIIQKWLEAIIDKTAEKGIAKYSDTLQRQTRAYEMLLQKEFGFFEAATAFVGSTILNADDISFYLGRKTGNVKNREKAEKALTEMYIDVMTFKRDLLLAQPYIPLSLADKCANLIDHFENKYLYTLWDVLALINDGKLTGEVKCIWEDDNEKLVSICATVNKEIMDRLNELSQ